MPIRVLVWNLGDKFPVPTTLPGEGSVEGLNPFCVPTPRGRVEGVELGTVDVNAVRVRNLFLEASSQLRPPGMRDTVADC